MKRLSGLEASFVRASPSGGVSGGLGRRTREALVVLDAAGFDPILVESVGTGQGELAITEAVDVVVAVLLPGAGDDIQGMKRGLFEHADLVVFNKADGDNLAPAERARDELAQVFAWMRPGGGSVSITSALEERGIDELARAIERRHGELSSSGELDQRRNEQRLRWFSGAIAEQVLERRSADAAAERARHDLEGAVVRGDIAPPLAARRVLDG
jgi:LAO/AO transport system kinase